MEDFRQYYELESYLFDVVRGRFKEQGYLLAFDFFCIVIWKANRAKSKIKKQLLHGAYPSLDALNAAARALTTGLASQASDEERFRYLCEWPLRRLPMISAILTVLYPDEFTVYDIRVCNELKKLGKGQFSDLANLTNFENLWGRYQEYKCAVEESAPPELSLRDKDRWLWGKSDHDQLVDYLKNEFKKPPSQGQGE